MTSYRFLHNKGLNFNIPGDFDKFYRRPLAAQFPGNERIFTNNAVAKSLG